MKKSTTQKAAWKSSSDSSSSDDSSNSSSSSEDKKSHKSQPHKQLTGSETKLPIVSFKSGISMSEHLDGEE